MPEGSRFGDEIKLSAIMISKYKCSHCHFYFKQYARVHHVTSALLPCAFCTEFRASSLDSLLSTTSVCAISKIGVVLRSVNFVITTIK